MKSAYEIAMERADKVYAGESGKENSLEIRDQLKETMASFFKAEIDAEDIWHKLKDERPAVLREAQLMLIESIGLRNSTEQIKRRQQAVVAIESLKEDSRSSFFEQSFTQAQSLQQQYQSQKEQLDQQVKQHLENAQKQNQLGASRGQGQSAGQGQMNAQLKQQLAQQISEFQQSYTERFNQLIEDMKTELNA